MDTTDVAVVPIACPSCGVRSSPPTFLYDVRRTDHAGPGREGVVISALDGVMIGVWAVAMGVALGLAVNSLPLPPPGVEVSDAAVERWAIYVVSVLIVSGLVGGMFVRPRGRWFEAPVGAFLIAGVVAFIVFDVWLNATSRRTAPRPTPAIRPRDSALRSSASRRRSSLRSQRSPAARSCARPAGYGPSGRRVERRTSP